MLDILVREWRRAYSLAGSPSDNDAPARCPQAAERQRVAAGQLRALEKYPENYASSPPIDLVDQSDCFARDSQQIA